MMEQRRIVELWERGEARVLVTVVRVEGSSYRRPGARLLLGDAGEYAGTISGGCLEAEVTRKAAWKVRDGAVVERYSTMFDDTAEVPYGLGCGGVVDLLLEPVQTAECAALLHAQQRALHADERSTVVTWLPGESKTLRRVVLNAAGEIVFASADLNEKKLACARGLLPGSEYEGRFVEEIRGPQRLFVFGAGDDAKPLVSMAAMMGWSVTAADGRQHLARRERFVEAARVVQIDPNDISVLQICAEDAVVVMTHSYEQDRALLRDLLPLAPRYLGLLGARHRSSLLVSEAAVLAGLTVQDCCERIWAPVGLDLGGDGPEAVALAVVAEVQAVCMGKLGASQRLSVEDVMRHVREGGVSRYLQTHCPADLVQ
ncbi:XdhC family protein [Edaphobacter flagellatus]|uniref:XdhC family protein n=1 Tax=Edaphobacter flagellatus TaxID=1933044 RepID=UPI0021B3C2EF|nr:XdhC/CoxI family protein [Edaphobacter flagellatus]